MWPVLAVSRLIRGSSPQSLVQTEAREVEETQIFFCHHATEVVAAETNHQQRKLKVSQMSNKHLIQRKSNHTLVSNESLFNVETPVAKKCFSILYICEEVFILFSNIKILLLLSSIYSGL